MPDTTVKKASSRASPAGAQGQLYLASGKHVAMRLWRDEAPHDKKSVRPRRPPQVYGRDEA